MKYLIPILALALSGCATLNAVTTTQGVLINQAITLGASVYISKAGGTITPPATYSAAQTARAQQVKTIATEIEGVAAGTTTVAAFNAAVASWTAKLNPSEQLIVQALLVEVDGLLATQMQKGIISAAATAAVTDVMNDFITAAKAYGAV